MSVNLFAYLDTAPTLEQMRETLLAQGVVYRHTLPADERWAYPMHVFGRAELRFVYHAGDPDVGDALVDGRASGDAREAEVGVRVVLVALVRRFGGAIADPRDLQRGAVL
jgi:hypothetical protein